MKADNNNSVNCFQCIHYAVTWEPGMPRACKLFGFKSAHMPSIAVYKSTGSACQGFAKKDSQKENRGG